MIVLSLSVCFHSLKRGGLFESQSMLAVSFELCGSPVWFELAMLLWYLLRDLVGLV